MPWCGLGDLGQPIAGEDGKGAQAVGRVRRAPRPAAREAEGLAAAGATLVSASTNDYGEYCVNMLDPEGNEFDVL
jgi:hypothetical protein